jgi:type I restriction enzyme S subunit
MKQGWVLKELGEVSEILNGGTPKTNISEYWDGDIHWITPADLGKLRKSTVNDTSRKITSLGLEKSSAKLFPENSIILSTRAPIGHLAINEVPMSTNQGCRGIVPGKKIDTWFLYYFLKMNVELLDSLGTGATFKELSTKSLAGIEIPLPPLPEQQRIVAILDEAFAAIAKAKSNAEQNLKNAKELFASYLQGVFENKGEGWEEKSIGEIGSPKMCKRIFKEQTASFGDIPFYKIGTFGKDPDAFISLKIYDEFRAKYSFPKKGDVLISASGTIGRRVRYNGEPAYFQDSNIVWIENDEKIVLNDFLYEFYGACNWGPTKGATISRLYNENLKSIKISFPKSKEVQQAIVHQLDALQAETQKLEAVYQKKIADLEELKKSILLKAFAGELKTIKLHEV